jgi:hypothetical protein
MSDPTEAGTMVDADLALTEGAAEPEAAAEEATKSPEQGRDEQGRFTAAEQAAAQASEAGEPAPESGEPQPTEAEVAEPEPDEPFVYRADGQEITVPGSDTGEDGVFFPTAVVPEIQQLLAAGRFWLGTGQGRMAQAAQQVQAARQEVEASKQESQHVLAHLEGLIEQSQAALDSGDWNQIAQSPLANWLFGVSRNWPVLKAQAQAKAIEMQNAAERQQLEAYRAQERLAAMRPFMQQSLHTAVERFGTDAGLAPEIRAQVEKQLDNPAWQSQVFIAAPYDDPGGQFRRGEAVINYGLVRQAVDMAGLGRMPSGEPVKPKPATTPSKAPATKPPPTVGKGGRAPAPRTAWDHIKSREEADNLLLDGELPEIE